ncbi:hypothetical protein Asi03nite_66020 [Actinoplanes siamensis]|uniref:Uncharacterized protein n=1 Tax=Actinoplanes siamensis TaxID=1223317 RepID=A0A919ND71_9ACTN|nr:hypothetical protein Asi03nite_66020 [Actinoplanes siamensis]
MIGFKTAFSPMRGDGIPENAIARLIRYGRYETSVMRVAADPVQDLGQDLGAGGEVDPDERAGVLAELGAPSRTRA